ncbi:hypothetical protein K0M31_007848 [Melipona bicolor]|uniref:Uncharacterized protein n=1 Tax=Melipona bicolor TaxID=60889 RepID=A0AA40KW42_9HYME|nr:hypothetical protein K0M31_007848 [Melipona bicolor]
MASRIRQCEATDIRQDPKTSSSWCRERRWVSLGICGWLPYVSVAEINEQLSAVCLIRPVYQIAVGNFESAAIAPGLKFFDRAPLARPDGTGEEAALLVRVGEFARSRESAGDILRGSPAGDDPGKSFADLEA